MNDPLKYRIVVCRGPECGERRDSRSVFAAFERALGERGVADRCEMGWQSCFGRCSQGPNVLVRIAPSQGARPSLFLPPLGAGQNAALYHGVRPEDAARIVEEHVLAGRIVRELIQRMGYGVKKL